MYLTGRQRGALAALLALVLVGTAGVVWRRGGLGGRDPVPVEGPASGRWETGVGRDAGGGEAEPGAAGAGYGAAEATGPGRGATAGPPGPGGAVPGRTGRVVFVHVVGSVARPGVYALPTGARVVDALTRAGGPAADGRPDLINLAAPLEDGQRVYVPSEKDARALAASGAAPWEEVAPGGAGGGSGGGALAGGGRAGRVNLNRAGVAELDALPGIGPSLAQRIVDHRKAHGPFRRVEDLERVPGIGPSKLEQLRPYLVVD